MKSPNPVAAHVARVVVIGGSAGAAVGLRQLLRAVIMDVPLVIAVHVGPSAEQQQFEWDQALLGQLDMPVRKVFDKIALERGCIYVCPADYHVLVEKSARLALSVEPRVNFCRPSIDVLFESAADAFGEEVVGVLLSGANEDGAIGARKIKLCGGGVAIQDPEEAEVPTMPRAGIALTEPDVIGRLEALRRFLTSVHFPKGNQDAE